MNYRHAFHAGNHADVLKHAILLHCLDHLKLKPAPFAVLDTHAGRGLYDLESPQALRSPEWRDGIAKLYDAPGLPPLLARYVAAVRAANQDGALRRYPGSPSLISECIRGADRLIACELHTQEAAELKRSFRFAPKVQVHARDGWEALAALIPFPERRGLILIDPPYEAHEDLARAAAAIRDVLKTMRNAAILWWRPLKSPREVERAEAEALAHANVESLRVDFAVAAQERLGPLNASSVLAINPPHTLAAELNTCAGDLLGRLATGDGAAFRLTPSA